MARLPKINFGVTAFIDVLGFGERVASAKTIEDIAAIAKAVKQIQGRFDFETKDHLTRQVQSMYKKTVLAFSDSIVIHLPLESEITIREGTFDPLLSELSDYALTQGECVMDGIFLRGGIDIGWWHRSGSTLVSGSLLNAYKTEGAVKIPVLALTPQITDFFSKHKHRTFYAKDIEPVSRLLREYVPPQGDPIWYLDYISISLESVHWHTSNAQLAEYRAASSEDRDKIVDDGYKHNINLWLKSHARHVEAGYLNAPEVAKDKYRWLAAYHDEIATAWTGDPDTFCNI